MDALQNLSSSAGLLASFVVDIKLALNSFLC